MLKLTQVSVCIFLCLIAVCSAQSYWKVGASQKTILPTVRYSKTEKRIIFTDYF